MTDHIPGGSLITPHRMPLLDAWRLVAALMVLCYHYLFCGHAGAGARSPLAFAALAPYAKYGFLGVHWFFMISGLVIAYSSKGRTAGEFWAARISRLVPGAWAAIFFLFAVFTFFPLAILPTNLATLFANLTFVPQLFRAPVQSASFWSIQTELIFYVLVAILIAANLWRHTLWLVTGWLAMSGVYLLVRIKLLNYIFLTGYAPLFCLGMLLFHTRQHGMKISSGFLMLVAFGMAAVNLVNATHAFTQGYNTTLDPVVLISLLLGMFLLLFGSIHITLPERWQRVCYAAGGITYPLYLVHESLGYRIFWWLNNSGAPAWAQFAIAATAAIIAAVLIWVFVERPLIPRLRLWLQNFLPGFLPVG